MAPKAQIRSGFYIGPFYNPAPIRRLALRPLSAFSMARIRTAARRSHSGGRPCTSTARLSGFVLCARREDLGALHPSAPLP